MPKGKNVIRSSGSEDIKAKDLRNGKRETMRRTKAFLDARKITYEEVLGYLCFTVNKKEYRANSVMGVKKALDIPL